MNFWYVFATTERVLLNEIQELAVRYISDKYSADRSTEIYSTVEDLLGYIVDLKKIYTLFNYYILQKLKPVSSLKKWKKTRHRSTLAECPV